MDEQPAPSKAAILYFDQEFGPFMVTSSIATLASTPNQSPALQPIVGFRGSSDHQVIAMGLQYMFELHKDLLNLDIPGMRLIHVFTAEDEPFSIPIFQLVTGDTLIRCVYGGSATTILRDGPTPRFASTIWRIKNQEFMLTLETYEEVGNSTMPEHGSHVVTDFGLSATQALERSSRWLMSPPDIWRAWQGAGRPQLPVSITTAASVRILPELGQAKQLKFQRQGKSIEFRF